MRKNYSYKGQTSLGASKPSHPKNPVGQKGMGKESYQLLQLKNKISKYWAKLFG
jgi:hypothetical protein